MNEIDKATIIRNVGDDNLEITVDLGLSQPVIVLLKYGERVNLAVDDRGKFIGVSKVVEGSE